MEDETLPIWLFKLLKLSVVGMTSLATLLVVLLALGASDQKPSGRVVWQTNFNPAADHDIHLWSESFSQDAREKLGPNGLILELVKPGMTRVFTRLSVGCDGAYEISGAQISGSPGAMFGMVFDYLSELDYAAVMVNNNGYVVSYRQSGSTRDTWVPLRQWPHVMVGSNANRILINVSEGLAVIRINDEVLREVPIYGNGAFGVIATSHADDQVVSFDLARCWSG